jgi:4-coumarate--CoA ligase
VVLKAHAKGRVDGPAIQNWIAERVSKHKRLHGGVVLVDEVPKSASGKIQRNEIRKWVEAEQSAENVRWKL